MPSFPVQSTIGDPIFRSQSNSIDAVRRFSRIAADASIKLNNQERIVSPGDDALSFSTSRRIRSTIGSLKVVQETGQLNITGLSLAIEAIDGIKVQLDNIKKFLIQAQVADDSEQDGLQSQIDLALSQIDSTAKNTKLGSRSLLDGSSTINAYTSIAADGGIVDFDLRNAAESLTQSNGIQSVKVNKVGLGGPVRLINDGSAVLSLRVSILSNAKAERPIISLNAAGSTDSFVEYRVTGRLGSAVLRLNSNVATTGQMGGTIQAFNRLAQETGVIMTSAGGQAIFTTLGFGKDEFVKIEVLNSGGTTQPTLIDGDGNTIASGMPAGTTLTEYGTAAIARINGYQVELSGENGTTARFLDNGFDLEIDFSTFQLSSVGGADSVTISDRINIRLTDGITGLLGATGDTKDLLQYGIQSFTTESLGRGNAQYTVTTVSGLVGGLSGFAPLLGNEIMDQFSIADLGSGGRVSLQSGNLSNAIRTIDRAMESSIAEQTRLGVLQGNFIDSVQRAEVLVGNLTSADADIIGVDAATEIANLVQAQLGVSTATSIMGQANQMQQTVYQLLR